MRVLAIDETQQVSGGGVLAMVGTTVLTGGGGIVGSSLVGARFGAAFGPAGALIGAGIGAATAYYIYG